MFLFFTVIACCILLHHTKKTQIKPRYAHAVFLLLLWFLMADIALAQNYFASLNFQDRGITVSNGLARIIIGADGWTIAQFQSVFNQYLGLTLVIFLLYGITSLREHQTLPYTTDRYFAFLQQWIRRIKDIHSKH